MDNNQISIKETTVRCFKIRFSKSLIWADITLDIDQGGKSGRLSIASDFGSWQYYWGAASKDFREFLIGINRHYMAGKFGVDREIDTQATIKQFRLDVITARKEGSIDMQTARLIWNEINDLEVYDDLINAVHQSDEVLKFYDYVPPISHCISVLFNRFYDEIWSEFVEHLKSEVLVEITHEEDGKEKTL